jgi:hypothetical protein
MRKEEKAKRKEAKEKEKREKESKERTTGTSNEADQEEDGAGGGGSGRLITTGQMGEVMQESCSIAYTCAKIYWNKLSEVHKQTTPAATSTTTSTKRAQSTQGTTVVGPQT